jgi:hypothetical protein
MAELRIEISATVVAWYAAIVATVALILNAFVACPDRARIVVTGMSVTK